jgi:protein SCO1/2
MTVEPSSTQSAPASQQEKMDSRKRDEASDARDWGFGRPLLRNPWFYFALILIAIITVSRPFLRRVAEPLPIIKAIPSFEFVSQKGEAFGSAQLAGKPYVASFIFTRCQTACPLISQRLAELQKQFDDGRLPVRLVSFSVDPSYDRPTVLGTYGGNYNQNPEVWTFVTSRTESESTGYLAFIESAFGVAVGDGTSAERQTAMDIAHSEKLLLVDASGQLRGVFGATPEGLNEIFHRSVALMGEPAALR